MTNPIKAYSNLNQANRRWVTLGAGAVATLVGGLPLLTPVAYGAAIADGFHFHKDKKVVARIRAGVLTLIVACAGGALVPDYKTAPVVAETPAPVVEVVEAPVVETPAPVVVVETPAEAPVVDPTVEGDFTTTSHWADEADTSNSGTATYNPETDTVSWHTTAFGVTDQDSCSNGKHNAGLDCSVTYGSDGLPDQAIVTDSYDGYRISTTTFRF